MVRKGLLLFETLSIQGALLVADPISKPRADFVLGAPAARHFSRRQQPTQTGLRLMSDYRLVIEEIKEAKATTSYTRWVDLQARGEFAASLAFASIHPKQIQGQGRIL